MKLTNRLASPQGLGVPVTEDAMIVSLEEITRLDPSILELGDLPLGWRAIRRSPTEPSTHEPNRSAGSQGTEREELIKFGERVSRS